MIYVARIEGNRYKIGWAKYCVWSRIEAHRKTWPTIEFLFSVWGNQEDEQNIHRRLARYRHFEGGICSLWKEHFDLPDHVFADLKQTFSRADGYSERLNQ